MKIVQVDNYDRDNVNDVLICENVDEYHGNIMVNALNNRLSGDWSDAYFVLKEDDYKLYKFVY